MFKKTSGQMSFFDINKYVANALNKDDWSYKYQQHILPLIDEDDFRPLYSESNKGRPNASIKKMVSVIIFMGLEQKTWRRAEYLFPRRLDWLNATETTPGESNIDHTTLFKFYQKLENNETVRDLFNKITNKFCELCGTSAKKQRTDSFFIHGWLQILSRYGLFKETITKFLRALRKHKSGLYKDIKEHLSSDYLKEEFDLTEKDRELAKKKVSQMAQDLYKLKTSFENHKQIQHYKSFKILCKVFSQQCEVAEKAGSKPEIVIKDKPDKDAINTPHNPEARYIRKGKQECTGDKGFVTETCDESNETQFITDNNVTQSNKHDSKEQPEIQKRLEESNNKPDKQYGDSGFVNGDTIIESSKSDIDLEGVPPGRSHSIDKYNNSDKGFTFSDFDIIINSNHKELIVKECPCGQTPLDQKKSDKTGKVLAHFDPEECRACEEKCIVTIGKRVATLKVDEADYISSKRYKKYMNNKEYRKECATRAGVEATVSELTRAHGMRGSRHKKRTRTKLQMLFACIACNIKRFIKHGDIYGYIQPKSA